MLSSINAAELYDVIRTWFAIILPVLCFITYFIFNAPFGRFAPKSDLFTVDAIRSWIAMETVAPLTFIYTYYHSPLTYIPNFTPHLTFFQPTTLLSFFFLIHYLNRAIISPLRTPSRNPSHIIVPLAAISFNLVNGFLMATYLSSPAARMFLKGAFGSTRFWVGLGIAVLGFVGNVMHDEILLDIRRKARAKGKGKAEQNDIDPPKNSNSTSASPREYYAIPQGLLFTYISFPNYFCEWMEWFGFALASSPLPSFASRYIFLATLMPPWLFLLGELFTMLPRALNGHKWYKERFGDYPKERRAIVPWLI